MQLKFGIPKCVLALFVSVGASDAGAQAPTRAACERACAALNEKIGDFRLEGRNARCTCECNEGWFRLNRGETCQRQPEIRSYRAGAPPLPSASWDCYCEYRYVTRPNGNTHVETLRTPEQQRAFERLKAMDAAS